MVSEFGLDIFALLCANFVNNYCYSHFTWTCEPYYVHPDLTAVRSTHGWSCGVIEKPWHHISGHAGRVRSSACALTEWQTPQLRRTFSNDHGKSPTPTRGLLVPDTCTFVLL